MSNHSLSLDHAPSPQITLLSPQITLPLPSSRSLSTNHAIFPQIMLPLPRSRSISPDHSPSPQIMLPLSRSPLLRPRSLPPIPSPRPRSLSPNHSPSPQIPVVMVVMQGSIGASNFLLEGLRAGTPAVVIHGSGGICDVVVNLVRHLKAVRNVSRSWFTLSILLSCS